LFHDSLCCVTIPSTPPNTHTHTHSLTHVASLRLVLSGRDCGKSFSRKDALKQHERVHMTGANGEPFDYDMEDQDESGGAAGAAGSMRFDADGVPLMHAAKDPEPESE
jgi:hypothetical protein